MTDLHGPDQPWDDGRPVPPQQPQPDASPWPPYEQPPYQSPPPYQQQPYQQQPYQQQPYQQQPYQQQPYQQYPPPYQQQPNWGPQYGQQQPGGYPLTAPPNRPSRRTPVILALVAVVVIVLAVVGAVVLTRGSGTKKDAQHLPPATGTPPSSPATSTPPTSAPATTSPTTAAPPTADRPATVTPVISGWQGVLSAKENVAYDVPPGWKIQTPSTLVGFANAKGQPVAIMHGVSTYKQNACPKVSGSFRGQVGFKTAGGLAPTVAARAGVQQFARGAAIRNNGTSAPVSGTTLAKITVDRGKIPAEYARATVRVEDTADCGSPTVVVVGVAFRTGPQTTALFIGYFDQGVAGALPLSTVRRVFTTLRPYRG